jgi:hypothetical protein
MSKKKGRQWLSSQHASTKVETPIRVGQPDDRPAGKMRETCDPLQRLRIPQPVFFVYIDGYNFYAAINHYDPPDLLRLGWCNFEKLGHELVGMVFGEGFPKFGIIHTKYFTSLVPEGRNGQLTNEGRRQTLWLECLKAETGIEPILGEHRPRQSKGREEKKTDVNISLEIFSDSADRRPTGLILISGDLDLQPAVVHAAKKGVPVAVFCPLGHNMYEVKAPAGEDWDRRVRTTHLTREILRRCRLSSELSNQKWPLYLDMKIASQSEFEVCRVEETRYALLDQQSPQII